MNEPLVSVVISTWNRVDLLRGAVESVCKQDYPNIELIIVDNASDDGTFDYLLDLRDQFVKKLYIASGGVIDDYVNNMGNVVDYYYIRLDKPDPSAMKTLNMGFSYAKGSYIMVLDDDALLNESNTMSYLVNMITNNTNIGLLCPNNISIDGCTHLLEYRDRPDEKLPMGRMYAYAGSCAIMRAPIFKDLGMYDESFVLYWNEADVAIKMLYSGWDVMYTNAVSSTHLASTKQRFMRKSLYYHLRNGNKILNRSLSFKNRLHIIPMRSMNLLYVILQKFDFDIVYVGRYLGLMLQSFVNIFFMTDRYKPYNKEIFREVNENLMRVHLEENKGWTINYWKNRIFNLVKYYGFRS